MLRNYHVTRELLTTSFGSVCPDVIQLISTSAGLPTRFYARTEWDEQIPIPLSYRTIRITSLSPKFVYAPFPNFEIGEGGIEVWLEWKEVTLPSVGLARILVVKEGVDLDLVDSFATFLPVVVDVPAWLQVLISLDKLTSGGRPSQQNLSIDIDTPLKSCFEKFGRSWITELLDAQSRRATRDFFRLREMEKDRQLQSLQNMATNVVPQPQYSQAAMTMPMYQNASLNHNPMLQNLSQPSPRSRRRLMPENSDNESPPADDQTSSFISAISKAVAKQFTSK